MRSGATRDCVYFLSAFLLATLGRSGVRVVVWNVVCSRRDGDNGGTNKKRNYYPCVRVLCAPASDIVWTHDEPRSHSDVSVLLSTTDDHNCKGAAC